MTNIDVPEGGLDALMQAIVCKDGLSKFRDVFTFSQSCEVSIFFYVEWRYGGNNDTRRLIVVATDGPFHIAGRI